MLRAKAEWKAPGVTKPAKRSGRGAQVSPVVERLGAAGVEAVGLAFVDNAGVTRVKCVPIERFEDATRWGIGLSNVFSVFLANDEITSAPGIDGPSGDTRLMPDPDATVALASMPGWAWAPVDQLTQDGTVWGACPRSFLKRTIDRLSERGLTVYAAFETEFFLGRREDPATAGDPEPDPVPAHSGPAYGALAIADNQGFALDLLRALREQGMEPLQFHAEYSTGQFEVSVAHSGALGACDDDVILRQTIRSMAVRLGLAASFAPVVFAGRVGNGHHIHLSLGSRRAPNLFAGGDGPFGMAAEAEAFSAGVLTALPALVAVMCPSVPSYYRLRPHQWAGAFTCWGLENREAPLRFVTGMTGSEARAANLEVKTVDGAANPYLALGSIIEAGLDGIDRGLNLPSPIEGDPDALSAARRRKLGIHRLPASLGEAIEALEGSALLRQAMGDLLFDAFVAVRKGEWAAFGDVSEEDVVRAHRWRY